MPAPQLFIKNVTFFVMYHILVCERIKSCHKKVPLKTQSQIVVAEFPDSTSAAGQVLQHWMRLSSLATLAVEKSMKRQPPAAANAAVPISKFMKVGVVNSSQSRPDRVVIRLPWNLKCTNLFHNKRAGVSKMTWIIASYAICSKVLLLCLCLNFPESKFIPNWEHKTRTSGFRTAYLTYANIKYFYCSVFK